MTETLKDLLEVKEEPRDEPIVIEIGTFPQTLDPQFYYAERLRMGLREEARKWYK